MPTYSVSLYLTVCTVHLLHTSLYPHPHRGLKNLKPSAVVREERRREEERSEKRAGVREEVRRGEEWGNKTIGRG